MKKLFIAFMGLGFAFLFCNIVFGWVHELYMIEGDLLPYYTFQVVDSEGTAVDISSTTITATVQNMETGGQIVTNGTCYITNGANGYAEYRWIDGETNTAGSYAIQFRILSGGIPYSLPTEYNAVVIIRERF